MKRNTIYKTFLAVILSSAMAACLSGCSGSKTASSQDSQTPADSAAVSAAAESSAPIVVETQGPLAAESADIQESSAAVIGIEEVYEIPVLFHPLAVSEYDTAQQKETNYTAYVTAIPEVHMSESEGDLYPELSAALFRDYKADRAEGDAAVKRFLDNLKPELFKDVSFNGFSHKKGAEIMRADSAVLSIRFGFSGWYGGPHDDYSVSTRNYSPKEGRVLTASDVFADTAKLAQVLEEKLKASYPEVGFFDLHNTLAKYDPSALPSDTEKQRYSFALTGDGAVFWFSPTELASYADGMQTVMLSYAEYPDLFRKEYTIASDSFATVLDNAAEYSCDAGNIRVDELFDENNIISALEISINGQKEKFSTFTYKTAFTLMKSGQRRYLYAFMNGDDDERWIEVYGLNNGKPTYQGRFDGYPCTEYDPVGTPEGADAGLNVFRTRNTTCCITDPDNFLLETKKDGVGSYQVGNDGMPVKQ